jgi:P4 family phage/plasmid primase-like protien
MNLTLDDLIIKDNAELAKWTNICDQLPIFPVCGEIGNKRYKAPLTQKGFKDASLEDIRILTWWEHNPTAMLGLATGQKSGIVAIDVDVKNVNGLISLSKLEGELGVLPQTFTVKTITGGLHICFKAPQDIEIPCSANQNTGIDFRGDGGYIVYAESKNSEGQAYEVIDKSPMAELPQEYIEFFQSKQKTKNDKTAQLSDSIIAEGGRNTSLTSLIGTFLGKGVTGDKLHKLAHMINKEICAPPLPEWEVDKIYESIGSRDRGYAHNPIGNGHRFADRHSDNVKCINKGNSKTWMIWDDTKWGEDELAVTSEYAKTIAIDLQSESEKLPDSVDKGIKDSLYGLARKTQETPHKILTMACSDPKIAISKSAFDKHDFILPCRNGIIDLNTGEFSQHDPNLFYTKIANASFDLNARSDIWEKYIKFFTNNDPEVEAFLARIYGGLGLIGDNPEQKAIFLLGRAKNGKSTMNNIMQGILSDYFDILRTEVLASRSTRDFRQDVADMVNARFIAVNEMPQNSRINSALFKSITGGDVGKGRQNYQDSEKFKVKGLISMTSNWEPQLDDGDEGIERRIIVYRNNNQIIKKDGALVEKILANPDSVLLWLYKGRMDYLECVKQYNDGLIQDSLNTPQSVINMTEGYINRRNSFRAFLIDECIVGNPKERIQASEFYGKYHMYVMGKEYNPRDMIGEKTFYEILANNFVKVESNGKSFYQGVRFK